MAVLNKARSPGATGRTCNGRYAAVIRSLCDRDYAIWNPGRPGRGVALRRVLGVESGCVFSDGHAKFEVFYYD